MRKGLWGGPRGVSEGQVEMGHFHIVVTNTLESINHHPPEDTLKVFRDEDVYINIYIYIGSVYYLYIYIYIYRISIVAYIGSV